MRRSHPKPDVEPWGGMTGKRRDRLVLRALTVLLAVPLGVAATAPSLASPTEAAWVVKQAAAAPATAMTIPRGTANTCRISSLIGLGTVVQIAWTPPPGYDPTKAEVHAGPPEPGTTLTPLSTFTFNSNNTSFDPATGRYTTSVPVGLLNGVLSNRTEVQLGVVMKQYGWLSRPASVVYNPGVLIGMAASCRVL